MCTCVWCGEFIEDSLQFVGGEPMHNHCVEEMNAPEDDIDGDFEDDGQPDEAQEWADYYGGDDNFYDYESFGDE